MSQPPIQIDAKDHVRLPSGHACWQIEHVSAKNGISQHYGPWTIMKRQSLDYNKHFVVDFGAYVQTTVPETKNTLEPWTLDGIYLSPDYTMNHGHYIYHIPTKRVIRRAGPIKQIPLTDVIIQEIERQGYPRHD